MISPLAVQRFSQRVAQDLSARGLRVHALLACSGDLRGKVETSVPRSLEAPQGLLEFELRHVCQKSPVLSLGEAEEALQVGVDATKVQGHYR